MGQVGEEKKKEKKKRRKKKKSTTFTSDYTSPGMRQKGQATWAQSIHKNIISSQVQCLSTQKKSQDQS